MGEAGRARARACSWERVTAGLLEVYAEALGDRPRARDTVELEARCEPELAAVPEAI